MDYLLQRGDGGDWAMLTTIEGVYRDGKIELSEVPSRLESARVLVTFLPEDNHQSRPMALYGAWHGKMPEDLDLNAELKEIRGEWMREWESERVECPRCTTGSLPQSPSAATAPA